MARTAQRILEPTLRVLARRVVGRYHPVVVGVTGSVGKTSTVQACALVLSALGTVHVSPKNYNNELGAPLAVLGVDSGGRSLFGWAAVIARGALLAYAPRRRYPAWLVLELAADKPGDLAYLVGFLGPRIGVVTTVAAAHLESFGTVSAVAAEKGTLVAALPADGTAILNADEPLVAAMANLTSARVLTYGFKPQAGLQAKSVRTTYSTDADGRLRGGIACAVSFGAASVPLQLPNVLGDAMIYAPLAALAVGVAQGLQLREAAAAVSSFTPPPGRLRLIAGIKRTSIIDDSYNSSPAAAQLAVRVLQSVPSHDAKKIAVLGDMLELGAMTAAAHQELGAQVARAKVDTLVTVGELGRDIARGAREAGMFEQAVFTFPDPAAAGRFLQDRLEPGDVLLVKGSQAVRMERIVKELMAEPQRAGELLVRQGREWQ